ncbi:DUF3488 and transglutaminase-like domain-containing protein [Catenulispora rubra]|uniref:DUF3488 and transglutaminase-like domain-containing protein n=1 Tax=Catenulispora rubra TaxID=280293 RepID=UPI0018926C41|nr:transglutaminase domain-containing protein [Catenulispora rubra]
MNQVHEASRQAHDGPAMSASAQGRNGTEPRTGRPALGQPLPRLVLGGLLLTAAAAAWERVFPAGPLFRTIAAAVLVPTVLVALRRTTRVPLWPTLPVGVIAWLLLIPLALPRLPGSAGPSANPVWALTSLRSCWYGLLTTPPPVPADPALMIGLYSLLWCAAWAGGEALTGSRRVLPVLAAGFIVLAAGVTLGTGSRGISLLAAGLTTGCSLLLLTEDSSWSRLAVLGAPAAASIAASAVLLAPATLGGRQAFDPRHLVRPQAQPAEVADPLDEVAGWLAHPATPLFQVAAPTGQDWRLAALDRFDGQNWSSTGLYWPVAAQVPESGTAAGPPLSQRFTIDALSGRWLPAASTPRSVSAVGGPGILADAATGSLLSREALQPGRSYDVVSQTPDPSAAELLAAVPDPGARADTVLPPGLPQTVRDTAVRAVAGATSPFLQANQLEHFLRTTEHDDPGAPPGHTYGHLAYFLGVSHRGQSEQFATAFAVMARSVGLPSRVVVGFQQGSQTAPGVWQVGGADAFVWPEVDFAGIGWVPFYPTPGASSSTDTVMPAEGQTPERAKLDQALDAVPPPAADRTASGGRPLQAARTMPPPARHATWLVWSVAAASIPVGYLAAVLVVPRLRRRRRRRLASTAASVGAAWQETVNRLRWVEVTGVEALTTAEVADRAGRLLGAPALAHLAPLAGLADAAAFAAPGIAVANSETGPDVRASAWTHHDHVAALIRRRTGVRAALWHTLRPRALRD